jgi:hypothetical protein
MAAASTPSMEGTGMAGSGTHPGRAATIVAAAVAGTEAAMAPAIAAVMAEGVAVAVAAGIERSSQPATGILFISCAKFFILSILSAYLPSSRHLL